MTTLGLWPGPTLAVVLAAAGNKWLGWFQPRSSAARPYRRWSQLSRLSRARWETSDALGSPAEPDVYTM